MKGEGSSVLNRPCDDLVENLNGSASASATPPAGMIKAQVEAILNHSGRQAQVNRKRPCEGLIRNPTRFLGTKAEWEGNARFFDCDEGRKAQLKRKRPCEDLVENPSAIAGNNLFGNICVGRNAQVKRMRSCEENPSTVAAGNSLFGMIKAQAGAFFNYLGRKAQVVCEDLVRNPSSASAAAGTTRLLGAKDEWVRLPDFYEGRKPPVKRKHPWEENPSGTIAQVTGGRDLPVFKTNPHSEILYEVEGGRLVTKIRLNPPPFSCKNKLPIRGMRIPDPRPSEDVLNDPQFQNLVASGYKVKVMGKHWVAESTFKPGSIVLIP